MQVNCRVPEHFNGWFLKKNDKAALESLEKDSWNSYFKKLKNWPGLLIIWSDPKVLVSNLGQGERGSFLDGVCIFFLVKDKWQKWGVLNRTIVSVKNHNIIWRLIIPLKGSSHSHVSFGQLVACGVAGGQMDRKLPLRSEGCGFRSQDC